MTADKPNHPQPTLSKMRLGMVETSRRDEAVKLKESGLTYVQIGRRFGISRERARQIVKGKPTAPKPDLRPKVMLTTSEAARLLGIHNNTVRLWSKRGILKACVISPRGDRRFRREDIDDFLKQGFND